MLNIRTQHWGKQREKTMTIQTDREHLSGVKEEYQYGFHDTEQPFFKAERGLNHAVIDQISDHKNEPDWRRQFRHGALDIFLAKPMLISISPGNWSSTIKRQARPISPPNGIEWR